MPPIEQIDKTTYSFKMPSGDKVEVGDKKSKDFKPHLKINRWGGECFIKVALQTTEKQLPIIQGDKIFWDGKKTACEFLPAQDNFKFNIILKEKPKTNVFLLDFDSDNLNFYKQPPLTQEFKAGYSKEFQSDILVTETKVTNILTGDVLVHRPENVVGSYAVYHATRSNMHRKKANADKYKDCKAFHWYRPLIWDTVSKKCWGELHIADGLRTVTIPQMFLDKAVYPVTIDDTFGYGKLGTEASIAKDFARGIIATCSGAGTGVSMSVYIKSYASGGHLKLALYTDGATSDLVTDGDCGEVEIPDAFDDWKTLNFISPPTIAAQDYDLAINVDGNGYLDSWYDNVADSARYKSEPYADFPSASYTWDDFSSLRYSLYCTYTPEAPPGAVGRLVYGGLVNSGLVGGRLIG